VASLAVTEGLPSPIFTREAPFAYVLFTLRLAEIYVPFVLSRQSRNPIDLRRRVPHGAMVVSITHHHSGGTRCSLF
jgi:hypothetical protein